MNTNASNTATQLAAFEAQIRADERKRTLRLHGIAAPKTATNDRNKIESYKAHIIASNQKKYA